jgi:urease alpha subunit
MATIEGAQAVGLGDEIGSLEVGKQADLILVDLTTLNLSPVLTEPIRNTVLDPVLVGQSEGGQPCPCRTLSWSDRTRARQGYRVSCSTWSTPAADRRGLGGPPTWGSVTLSGCLPVPEGHGSIQPGI